MGGRSSKTKPARSPAKSQNQDTVVESFNMGAVDDMGAAETGDDSVRDTSKKWSGDKTAARKGKQATQEQNAPGRGAAAGNSVVHNIWEGKVDNNLAPLSALYGKNARPLELQVSSSEDEDDEYEGGNHRKRKKSTQKKKKSHTPKPAAEKSKLSALRPVKPPPAAHALALPHPDSLELQIPHPHDDDDNVVKAIGDEKDSSTSPQKSPTGKVDSPSRFFAFKRRMSSSRPTSSTQEKDTSVREKDTSTRVRSSGSPEKAASASPNPKAGASSLGQFMEWKEGTYRSTGRESTSRLSEIPGEETTADGDKDEVEDFDALERETANALASNPVRAPTRRPLKQNQSEQLKENEKRAAATSSPAVSGKSQRSSRSAGRNLNIDDVDEHIMSDILAEALDT